MKQAAEFGGDVVRFESRDGMKVIAGSDRRRGPAHSPPQNPPTFEPSAFTPFGLESHDQEQIRRVRNKRKAARKAGKPLPRWP